MTRNITMIMVLMLVAGTAAAQNWNGPNPLEEMGIGVMGWEHPLGDQATLPCTHMVQQHPNGHATTIPCAHMVPQHPNGHTTKVPCTHLTPMHPNGDPVMVPCLHLKSNGQPKHPSGHQQIAPCVHLNNFGQPKHPNGHPVFKACTHMQKQHPNDHNGPNVPCTHMVPQHPGGHPGPTTPCAHMVQQHPAGHQGPKVPCAHPVPVKSYFKPLNVYFYTDNEEHVKATIQALKELKREGVNVTALRPLHVFFRDPVPAGEYPAGAVNPTWPHYNPAFHSIQVYPNRRDWKSTLHHELGHATLGNSCVQIIGGGGQHTMTGVSRPGVAMSEGWAHFCALVIQNNQGATAPKYKGFEWEKGTKSNGDSAGKPSSNVEFRVGCALWDLYDKQIDGKDTVNLNFKQLFRVYSPTLQVLTNGPFIPNFADYLKRLRANHPALASAIQDVGRQNTVGERRARLRRPRPR